MQNAKCKIMLANATAMMTAMQSQLCFAYANRNYVPKGNAVFTPLRSAHKENYNKNHCERSATERSSFCILHSEFCIC